MCRVEVLYDDRLSAEFLFVTASVFEYEEMSKRLLYHLTADAQRRLHFYFTTTDTSWSF